MVIENCSFCKHWEWSGKRQIPNCVCETKFGLVSVALETSIGSTVMRTMVSSTCHSNSKFKIQKTWSQFDRRNSLRSESCKLRKFWYSWVLDLVRMTAAVLTQEYKSFPFFSKRKIAKVEKRLIDCLDGILIARKERNQFRLRLIELLLYVVYLSSPHFCALYPVR